jgi:hypothetical protein
MGGREGCRVRSSRSYVLDGGRFDWRWTSLIYHLLESMDLWPGELDFDERGPRIGIAKRWETWLLRLSVGDRQPADHKTAALALACLLAAIEGHGIVSGNRCSHISYKLIHILG